MALPNLRLAFAPRLLRTITVDFASVAANTTAEQTTAVAGVMPDMLIEVRGNSLPAGLAIVNAHCETAGTLIITFANFTGSGINPASQAFEVIAF